MILIFRSELSIPVFSNGGVETLEDAHNNMEITNADGIMASGK